MRPSERLNQWQEAGDSLLWKIIISPERGDELDLELFTKELLALMDKDLGLRMEWAAVVHKNTHHHHVHLVIRGIDKDGKEVSRLTRDVRFSGGALRSWLLQNLDIGWITT